MATVQFKYRPPPGLLGPAAPAAAPTPAPQAPQQPAPQAPEADPEPAQKVDRWWYESSWDLRHGLQVSDGEDTVPAELLDELFKEVRPPRRK